MSEAVIGLKFGTLPPKPKRGGGRGPSKEWQKVADDLRANPGQWAQLEHSKITNYRQAYSQASRIRKGSSAFGPEGAFEAQVRGENRDEVWVCYVGEPETASVQTESLPASEDSVDENVHVAVEDEDYDDEEDADEEQPVVTF